MTAADQPVPDVRVDPFDGTRVHVVHKRQGRPNLPTQGCPFCIGGLEAPEPYEVRTFTNRWPAMPGDRCEVVLYTPDHDATFWSLGTVGIRRVIDLWASRTSSLGERADVDHVLVFENRGATVGATIAHPHGQIYAYDHVPDRPLRRLDAGWVPDAVPGDRAVAMNDSATAWVPYAPTFPIEVAIAPRQRVGDLPSLDDAGRDGLAALLGDVLRRLDGLYDTALPYMLWINQRPFDNVARDVEPWLNIEIVSPWRAADVPRFIAAAEVASHEYFNPVVPEELATQLRELR